MRGYAGSRFVCDLFGSLGDNLSLTQFVKRPAIRQAFKAFAIPERTPIALKRLPLLVPDSGGPNGLAGTAFDFLARYHVARELRGRDIKLFQSTSVVDQGLERLERIDVSRDHKRRWIDAVAEARSEGAAYARGHGSVRRLADFVQYLARIDVLYRAAWFDPEFYPLPNVSDEILRLLELFDPATRLSPQAICFLNPAFVASPKVGGADADLVVDDRLIDLKTTARLRVSLDNLLQLAGYAALHRMGGIVTGKAAHLAAFQTVEMYFARYSVFTRWRLDELFPGNGFDRFCEAMQAEIADSERQRNEWYRQFDLRQAEWARQDQQDEQIARIERATVPRDVLRLLGRHERALRRPDSSSRLHDAIFDAIRRTIRSYGSRAKRGRRRKFESVKSEIAEIRAMTRPLELLQAFHRNEDYFSTSPRHTVNSSIPSALIRAAKRIGRN